jgi:hypothetical protein
VKQELNLVKCYSYSAAGFLDNNDINVTATCFEVDLPNDIFRVHVSPYFWEFAFSKAADRTIRVVDSYNLSKYTSTTCIRLAFKAFEMDQFKLDMEGLDPTNGTFANSQKEKLDQMKSWEKSPFHTFDCKKKKNKNCFMFVSKHDKVACTACKKGRVNKTCSNSMCKKCCVNHALNNSTKCKCKEHYKAMQKEQQKLVDAELLVDGVDVNVEECAGEVGVGDEAGTE